MGDDTTSNIRVSNIRPLLPPACLEEMLPLSPAAAATVTKGRADVISVIEVPQLWLIPEKMRVVLRVVLLALQGTCDRFLVIVGPCSIHDTEVSPPSFPLSALAAPCRYY